MKLNIHSTESDFEDFKDQLKKYLELSPFNVTWNEDDLDGVTLGECFSRKNIEALCELLFNDHSEILYDVIRDVTFIEETKEMTEEELFHESLFEKFDNFRDND